MMLRMSTLSSVLGDAHPRTQACTRNRNARTKIQSPRRITAVDAARASPVRRSFRSGRERNRDAGEEQEERRAESGDDHRPCETADASRASTRVQLSRMCASIMIRTARPRIQSRYPRRWLASLIVARRTSDARRHFERDGELDVLPHRVPHGAVLFSGQLNRALDLVRRHVAGDGEVERDRGEAVGLFRARCAGEVRAQAAQIVLPFLRTCTTSIAMQPASANASACIGEGPAMDALSRVIVTSPDCPPNTRSCSQISSMTVGGFAERLIRHSAY